MQREILLYRSEFERCILGTRWLLNERYRLLMNYFLNTGG